MGRFLIDRNVRVQVMKERMADVWKPGKWVYICELARGVFLFQFYHKLDLHRVFQGVHGSLMVICYF